MLSKPYRLHRGPLLNAAFKAGKRLRIKLLPHAIQERCIDILALYNNQPNSNVIAPRFCFVVSKKVSNRANKRNKMRRRLREIIRTELLKQPVILAKLQQQQIRAIIILARPNIMDVTYEQLKAQVVHSII